MSVIVEQGEGSSRVHLVQVEQTNRQPQTKTSGQTELLTSATGGPTVLVVSTGTKDINEGSNQVESTEGGGEWTLLQTPGEERNYRRFVVLADVPEKVIETTEAAEAQGVQGVQGAQGATSSTIVVSRSGRQSTMTNHSRALSHTSSDAVSYVIGHPDDGTEYREMNENTLKLYYGERTPYGTVTRRERSKANGSNVDVTSIRSGQSGDVTDVTYQHSTSQSIYSTLMRGSGKGTERIPLRSNDLFYKDFLPTKLKRTTCFRGYKPFAECVVSANEWLEENRNVTLIRCESVRHRLDHSHVINPESTTSHDRSYLIGIRLWLRHLAARQEVETKIGYKNFVPRYLNEDEKKKYKPHDCPYFEDLQTTLDRINEDLEASPLRGSVLNVEVVPVNYSLAYRDGGELDSEQSYFCIDFLGNWNFFNVRIFYICSKRTIRNTRIGYEDFTPSPLTLPPSKTQFQKLNSVVSRVNRWIQSQRKKDIVGVQVIELPFKPKLLVAANGNLKTNKMCYEPSKISVYWHTVRFVRVWYMTSLAETKRQVQDQVPMTHMRPEIAVRTFVPCQLTEAGCCGIQKPIFATTRDTVQRISEWLQKTGADLIYIETDNVEKWSSSKESIEKELGERTYNKEDYHATVTKSALEYRLTIFRVFYRPNELTTEEEQDSPSPVKPVCCFVGCTVM
ncbi:uncharacterized protein LOC100180999 isoform X5 [Ciona intestinalis]